MLDHPGGLVELTTRTQHGRLLLLPAPKTNDIILGVLGRAQAKYDVTLHAFNFQANHEHIMGTMDDEEQMALFMAYLNGNLAKELGRFHGWREKFWGRRYHSASISLDESDQIRRYQYILAKDYDSYCTSLVGLSVGEFGRGCFGSPGSSLSTSVGFS